MEISATESTASSVITLAGKFPQSLAALKLGQLVIARVISVDSSQRAQIDVAGVRVQAQTTQALVSGQSLNLMVVQDGARLALKIVNQTPSSTLMNQALRQVLPQQIPLTETMMLLAHTVAQSSTGSQLLPAQIYEMIKAFLDRSLTQRDLTRADGVKMAVRDSGLFLEALLASPAGHAGIENDLKTRLLRLRMQIRQALEGLGEQSAQKGELLKLLKLSESALARMTMNQLSSLRESSESMIWYTEVPLQHQGSHEVVQFKFERNHPGEDEAAAATVTVTVRLNLMTLGPVEAKVMVLPQTVRVTFRAENTQAVDLIRDNLDALSDDFSVHGLATGEFYVLQSTLEPFDKITPPGLVDERV
jgi:hypothetical protein